MKVNALATTRALRVSRVYESGSSRSQSGPTIINHQPPKRNLSSAIASTGDAQSFDPARWLAELDSFIVAFALRAERFDDQHPDPGDLEAEQLERWGWR
jgi:hypothetical protein